MVFAVLGSLDGFCRRLPRTGCTTCALAISFLAHLELRTRIPEKGWKSILKDQEAGGLAAGRACCGQAAGSLSTAQPGLDAGDSTPQEGQAKASGTAGRSRLTNRPLMDPVESQIRSWKGSSKPLDSASLISQQMGGPSPLGETQAHSEPRSPDSLGTC